MTDYEKGYKDGMAGAALPNIIDNGDKIDGYAYSYKTDSEGVPYINIDSVRAMLTKAADVQPVDKWISVKDRLPEDDGKYMVWYKGELDICEFDVESQTFGYTYDDYDEMYSHLVCWDDGMDKDITHWMPLPELPKDGDTECHDTK